MRGEVDAFKVIIGIILVSIVAVVVIQLVLKGGSRFSTGISCGGNAKCVERSQCQELGGDITGTICEDPSHVCCTNYVSGTG